MSGHELRHILWNEIKEKEAKGTKKHLMCPVFREGTFRSQTRKETDEVIHFTIDAHI